jgi:site-specific DNA-cytosine methylase
MPANKPLAFKVRTQGHYNGSKGGTIKSGGGGAGALWYEDKTFTVATHQDQWLCIPTNLSYKQMTTPNEQIKPPAEPSLRYLSVCSGMEAASVAWEPLGFVPVGFSEIEPFPCAILKHRFPNTTNYGSLTEHHTWPIEQGAVDLLVGGTPCQSFSVAGLRKGMSDPRGNLALTFLALADRVKPKWIVWENVPGVLSSSGGRDFGAFLGALVELGYGFAYRVLDAQHFGVPQRRRRVFVVACLGDWRAPAEVLSLREGLLGYLEKGKQKRKGAAADAPASPGTGGSILWSGSDQANAERLIDKAGTLNCDQGQRGGFICPMDKPIVIDRAAFNQGINAQYEPHIEASETMDSLVARCPHAVGVPPICADKTGTLTVGHGGCAGHQHRMGDNSFLIGQTVPTPFRKSKRAQSVTDDESWVADGKANTLNNFDLGDTRTTHAVVEPIQPMLYENHPNDSRVTGPHEVAPTVVTRFGTGGGNVPLVNQEPKIIKVSELRLTGKITEQDVCPTLTSGAKQGDSDPLAITFQPGNLRRDAGADPSTIATTTLKATPGDQMPHVAQAMAVRRLTPVECERLQGFPDNWSRIPWKGKTEEQCPDGPRYKACGNSMAVPVMRWIGERIKEIDANLPK